MIRRLFIILFVFSALTSFANDSIPLSKLNNRPDLHSAIILNSFQKSPLKINKRRWGPEILAGAESGVNFTNIKQVGSSETKYKFGLYSGVFVRLVYNETVSIQSGLYYSSEGYKLKSSYVLNTGEKLTDDLTMNHSYIKLPLIYRITFGEKIKINIDLGGYSSILVYARHVGSRIIEIEGETPINGKVNEDAIDDYKRFDTGFTFSSGFEYPLTDKRKGINYLTFFRAGYDVGLLSISNYDLARIKNRNIHAGIGVVMAFD